MKVARTCAVVVGGASGRGSATAAPLFAQGANVTVFCRDIGRARKVAEKIVHVTTKQERVHVA